MGLGEINTCLFTMLFETPRRRQSREIEAAVKCVHLELWGVTDLRESSR